MQVMWASRRAEAAKSAENYTSHEKGVVRGRTSIHVHFPKGKGDQTLSLSFVGRGGSGCVHSEEKKSPIH